MSQQFNLNPIKNKRNLFCLITRVFLNEGYTARKSSRVCKLSSTTVHVEITGHVTMTPHSYLQSLASVQAAALHFLS